MQTYRTPDGILQVVHRRNGPEKYLINLKGLHNAAEKMRLLEDSGFTPRVLKEIKHSMLQEDLGLPDDVMKYTPEQWQTMRRGLLNILLTLRQVGIRHGDFNGNNIIPKDAVPYLIDWQESHFIGEKPPQSMPLSDTHWVCQNLIRWIGNSIKSDPYRVCRRWAYIYSDLYENSQIKPLQYELKGKTLLDIGCFQGDFTAFAAAEYMMSTGIDSGGFRSGENSIEIGRTLWPDIPEIKLIQADVIDWPSFKYDVVLFMDTFPYVVRDHGKEAAIALLHRIVKEAGRVYFETQQWGDQSGIEWLKTDEDVQGLVPVANWVKIVTIPENGVPRTIWKITKEVIK